MKHTWTEESYRCMLVTLGQGASSHAYDGDETPLSSIPALSPTERMRCERRASSLGGGVSADEPLLMPELPYRIYDDQLYEINPGACQLDSR